MVELNSDALSNSKIQAVSSNDLLALAQSIQEKLGIFKVNEKVFELTPRTDNTRLNQSQTISEPQPLPEESGDVELF